jgi:multiple sugar transport system substrate-binding protein
MQQPLLAGQLLAPVVSFAANDTQNVVQVIPLHNWQSTKTTSVLRDFDHDTTSDMTQNSFFHRTNALLADRFNPRTESTIDNGDNNAPDLVDKHNEIALEPLYISSLKGVQGTFFASDLMQQVYRSIGYRISVVRYNTLKESLNSYLSGADGELARAEVFANVTPLLVRVPEPLIRSSFYLVCRLQVTCAQILPKDTQVAVSSEMVVVERWAKQNQLLIKYYESFDDLLGTFNRGEIDFMILGSSDIFANQIALPTNAYRTILTIDFYHYLHKKNSELVPLIDRALKKFKTTDEYQQLKIKYWLHGNR